MSLPKLPYRGRVPLLQGKRVTNADWNIAFREHRRILKPFEVTRPSGRLRAGWMDDFVQTGRNVRLCEDCARFYGDWWMREGYVHCGHGNGTCTACDGGIGLVNLFRKRENN